MSYTTPPTTHTPAELTQSERDSWMSEMGVAPQSSLGAIETKADAAQGTANTAEGKADAAQGTANAANSRSTTNQTNIATINAKNFVADLVSGDFAAKAGTSITSFSQFTTFTTDKICTFNGKMTIHNGADYNDNLSVDISNWNIDPKVAWTPCSVLVRKQGQTAVIAAQAIIREDQFAIYGTTNFEYDASFNVDISGTIILA